MPVAAHEPPSNPARDSYMGHLELLMAGCPRALLVAGQRDAEAIILYS